MIIPSGSKPFVIDSSGWLEYLTADTKSDSFASYFKDSSQILIPSLVLFEVRKVLLSRHTKVLADTFVSNALLMKIVPLDEKIALNAASLSIDHKLTLADAIIYASTLEMKAVLVTSDDHFKELKDVIYI